MKKCELLTIFAIFEETIAKKVNLITAAANCPKSRFGDRAGGTLRVKQLRGKEGGKLGLKKARLPRNGKVMCTFGIF